MFVKVVLPKDRGYTSYDCARYSVFWAEENGGLDHHMMVLELKSGDTIDVHLGDKENVFIENDHGQTINHFLVSY